MTQPTNLRETKRQLAKEAREAKAPKSNVAELKTGLPKKIAPSPDNPQYAKSSYQPRPGEKLYEATGGCGVIVVRSSKGVMTAGLDVSDLAGSTERRRQGQVWGLFPTTEEAEKRAEKLRAQGYTVRVVEARPYQGGK